MADIKGIINCNFLNGPAVSGAKPEIEVFVFGKDMSYGFGYDVPVEDLIEYDGTAECCDPGILVEFRKIQNAFLCRCKMCHKIIYREGLLSGIRMRCR